MLCFYNFTTKLINLVLFENLVFPVWDYLALIVCYSDKISYYVCNFLFERLSGHVFGRVDC